MLGAVCGDLVGSRFESRRHKCPGYDFELFTKWNRITDDSVLTCAVAESLIAPYASEAVLRERLVDNFHRFVRRYPRAGYGGRFVRWVMAGEREPYNSFGNGSAMRVSPAGWVADSLEETERLARITAEVTHNHPEGIKGAVATAGAVFLARTGSTKDEIRDYAKSLGYSLDRAYEEIRSGYHFDVTCQGSVPEAIVCFLESDGYEAAIRKAAWLNGDTDTQAAIAGGIAEAFYGMPEELRDAALYALGEDLADVYWRFNEFLLAKTRGAKG